MPLRHLATVGDLRPPGRRWQIVLVACAAIGCAEAGTYTSTAHVVDSAGIRIHVSQAPRDTIPDVTVVSRQLATIGADDNVQLENVNQAIRLTDGTVVFVESRAREAKAFHASTGQRSVARRGAGPGEVQFPSNLMRLRADSFQLYDRRLGKVVVFAPDGRFAHEIQLNTAGQRLPSAVWRFQDTLLIGVVPQDDTRREVAAIPGVGSLGVTWVSVVTFDLTGAPTDTLLSVPGYSDIRTVDSSLAPVYGFGVPIAIAEDGIIHGTGEAASYGRVDADGVLRAIFRLRLRRMPVDRDSLAALLESDRALPAHPRAADNPILMNAFLPDSQPAYKEIRVFNGNVWLGSGDPFQLPPKEWYVVSPDGEWLATVGLPSQSQLLDVRETFVILRRIGEFDVQRIEVYELSSIGGSS